MYSYTINHFSDVIITSKCSIIFIFLKYQTLYVKLIEFLQINEMYQNLCINLGIRERFLEFPHVWHCKFMLLGCVMGVQIQTQGTGLGIKVTKAVHVYVIQEGIIITINKRVHDACDMRRLGDLKGKGTDGSIFFKYILQKKLRQHEFDRLYFFYPRSLSKISLESLFICLSIDALYLLGLFHWGVLILYLLT